MEVSLKRVTRGISSFCITMPMDELRGCLNMPRFSGVCFAFPRNVIWPALSGPNCLIYEFKKNGGLRCQLQLMQQLKRNLWLKS